MKQLRKQSPVATFYIQAISSVYKRIKGQGDDGDDIFLLSDNNE